MRSSRTICAPGKSFSQLAAIIKSFQRSGQSLILTRVEEAVWNQLHENFPFLKYSPEGRVAYLKRPAPGKKKGTVAIVTAGTSDLPVAEEARITVEMTGRRVKCFYDCGVAGIHRLLDQLPKIQSCSVIICIAGMDGVLPSLLAGLVDKPLVAVPTSVGYGAHFKGIAPLLTMLNTCAQGVAVVNIDNGFGAACFAALVAG